jgi:hypothetical protein
MMIARIALLMLLASGAPVTPADVSGVWHVDGYFEVDHNVRVDLTCTFKQDDQKLTGSCTGRKNDTATVTVSGAVKDRKVDWTFEFDSSGTKFNMTITGTLDDAGSVMKGRLEAAGQDGPFTATKE